MAAAIPVPRAQAIPSEKEEPPPSGQAPAFLYHDDGFGPRSVEVDDREGPRNDQPTRHRSASGTSPTRTNQSALGMGMPSLAENCASSSDDRPIETTDRSKNTSVRYANDTAHRLTNRGMA